MAHTSCPNGHDMWNGDGKPVVLAVRIKGDGGKCCDENVSDNNKRDNM